MSSTRLVPIALCLFATAALAQLPAKIEQPQAQKGAREWMEEFQRR
jgi:hypothetical protein